MEHGEVGVALTHLGDVYRKQLKFQLSVDILERALRIHERSYGLYHLVVALTLQHLGEVCGELEDLERKDLCISRALAIRECVRSSIHGDMAC